MTVLGKHESVIRERLSEDISGRVGTPGRKGDAAPRDSLSRKFHEGQLEPTLAFWRP